MDAKELLVHDRGQRESTEGRRAGLVHPLGIFVLAFELEGEVVGQVPAFVVASQQPERGRVPDLQGPEIEDALDQGHVFSIDS